jgi:hypothetical protein
MFATTADFPINSIVDPSISSQPIPTNIALCVTNSPTVERELTLNPSATPPDTMGDVQDLARRAAQWKDDTAELDQLMTELSTFSDAHAFLVRDAARALLGNAHGPINSGLNAYPSALCHVYVARGCTMNEREQAISSIQQASNHLETLREDSKRLAALGITEEHPQVRDLAAKIEELKR